MKSKVIKVLAGLLLPLLLFSCSTVGTLPSPKNSPEETSSSTKDRQESRGKSLIAEPPETISEPVVPAQDIYPGTGNFIGTVNTPVASADGGDVTLNFQNSPIGEVVKTILGDILGVNYVVNESVSGAVSMRTTSPVHRDDLIPLLDNLLRLNGAAIIKSHDYYEVTSIDEGVISALTPTTRLSADKGYQILIVPLRYIGAREMTRILEPVKSGRAVVQADEFRNLLTIAGTHSELFSLRETISIFDVDQLKGMSVGIFPVQNVGVDTVLSELQTIFGDSAQGPLAGMVRFTVLERLNALMVITPQKKYLQDVETWISRLDQAENAGGMNMYVYYVQNGKAENLASLLNQLFETKRRSDSASRQLTAIAGPLTTENSAINNNRENERVSSIETGNITVIPDIENNALLVLAAPPDYAEVEKAMEKLDILPMQVLVEASIVEVTLGDNLEYGLQWFFKDNHGKFNGTGGLNIPSNAGAPGTPSLDGVLNPANFTYAVFDAAGTRALLNAVAGDSKINVLSSPSLMVLDNQKATIRVGDQVPVRTSETSNTSSGIVDPDTGLITSNITSQIQYRDTGVTLEVTPRVNAGGMVMLEITQRVDDVDETTSSNIDSPTILQREITTSVAVQSGETIVLGGLIREDKEESKSGIPFLKDIPVAGALFGGKKINTSKTELVVMITPSAVANPEEARRVTEEYKSKLKGVDLSSFK